MTILPRAFYARDTAKVALELLGKRLVRSLDGRAMSGIITETEAYGHTNDPSSHAHRRMTRRNSAMFGEVGRAYVYFTYGMHYCFNVVARPPGMEAGAVLVRAISPDAGIETMKANRGRGDAGNLANGPAKLAQALAITVEQYGEDLTVPGGIHIEDSAGTPAGSIIVGPRIGVKDTRDWNFRMSSSSS